MLDKIMSLFRYNGPIPKAILLRASALATLTHSYIAFDSDGTCYMYPVPPLKLENSKKWIPSGRIGPYQREEIKFTDKKYRYSNWDLLISPDEDVEYPFTRERYHPTKKIPKGTTI